MTESANLPTVEECVEFKRLVDVGRAAAGLEPIDVLEFDDAMPMSPFGCLSARNLFCAVEWNCDDPDTWGDAGGTTFRAPAAIIAALDAQPTDYDPLRFVIPDAILAVTDPFDYEVEGLRARLVEAGVVAP